MVFAQQPAACAPDQIADPGVARRHDGRFGPPFHGDGWAVAALDCRHGGIHLLHQFSSCWRALQQRADFPDFLKYLIETFRIGHPDAHAASLQFLDDALVSRDRE